MSIIIERFDKIKSNITSLNLMRAINIIAVSKTFTLDHIRPLIDYGHTHFGENKVQEAISKWGDVKNEKKNIKLHMIGKLQTNKSRDAVKFFDYIHSLDNQKLADALAKNENNFGKNLKYFIQVNVGNEAQKSGIPVNELDPFYNYCVNEINLNIVGLMIIPPNNNNVIKYFKLINELNNSLALENLSMGMSADYIDAVKNGATFVRVGSSIFGQRS
jgi:PLP dependent protein